MSQNLIQHWGLKSFYIVTIFNTVFLVGFLITGGILIDAKVIHLPIIAGVNLIMVLIIYGFSIGTTSYETVYQIKTDLRGYNTKLYRWAFIMFGFGWLIFFIAAAMYMFAFALYNQTDFDYFSILSSYWLVFLILSIYHILLLALHRQLFQSFIYNQGWFWENKKIKRN